MRSMHGNPHLKNSISSTMAKIPLGILGAFVGTAGPITGYIRDNQNIIRASRSAVTFKRTGSRAAQQEKIRLCNGFTKAFSGTGFFSKTFPAYGSTGTGYNRATSAIMNQALVGSYPQLHLSYPKLLIAKGMLPGAEEASAVAADDGSICFRFTDNNNTGTASGADKIVLVVYAPVLQQALFSLHAGLRRDGSAVLQAAIFKGYAVETWMAFLSNDETNASDSVYTGSINL